MYEWIKQLTDNIQPQLIEAIWRLVAIESVQSEPKPNAPYGIGPKQALDEALAIASELGFKTVNVDNKIGYALLKGTSDSDDYIGIFGHVDTVPLGDGWTFHPLGKDIANGKLYGRGVLDNKGPILSNLFALYVLKQAGITFKHDVRIVFGCNEESGFGCVKHYVATQKPALFGWTPDCKWPTVYGERGRLKVCVSSEHAQALYQFMNTYLLPNLFSGKLLGIDYCDDDFGQLLMRGYKLYVDNNKHCLEWALSYPNSCTVEMLFEAIKEKASHYQLDVENIGNWHPVLYDKHSPLVKTLQQVYNECTQQDATPVTTTGGTYAKIVPNIIAYGPSFPGQKNIAHLPDEWMNITDLAKITEIYAKALYRLKEV